MRYDDGWPHDPRLDPFRNAVWELSRKGNVEAHLTCRVIPTRSSPAFWEKSELLWYRVNCLDGHRDRPLEDHGPGWPVVTDLERGRLVLDDLRGTVFDARRLDGTERDELWRRFGPS